MLKSLALIVFLCTLVVATHSRIIQPDDINLIQQTCRQTPNYDHCINYLKADPRSATADIKGLALIMVDIIKTKASNTLDKINQLSQYTTDPNLKKGLSSCADGYKAITGGDVPQAISALTSGDPKFAENAAADASVEATKCGGSFTGNSPLASDNDAMNDAAVIAKQIIRLLL